MLNIFADVANFMKYFFYAFSFITMYIEIFFLVTFLEFFDDLNIKTRESSSYLKDEDCPGVTITVPAYNEGENIRKTVNSLLASNYPKDKLFLILVDDGSKDNTFEIMNEYKDHPQIKVFTKPNGGKYTAQNLGIVNSHTDFVGSIDADCTVDKEALRRMMNIFVTKKHIMGVSPATAVVGAKNMIQSAQAIDYQLQIYVKKMFSFVKAMNVISGTFPIFRKEVFDKIGLYVGGHQTEDQELTLRMQINHMEIEHAYNAYVFTSGMKNIPALYKQRKRWIYGFIKNTLDYRKLMFNSEYGNIGFISLPVGFLAIFAGIFLFLYLIFNIYEYIYLKYLTYSAVGFSSLIEFNFTKSIFFIDTSAILFLSILFYIIFLTSVYISGKMYTGKGKFSMGIIYYFVVYAVIAPFWMMRALYNAIRNTSPDWTKEIDARIK
jgi:cellulose synthase/poly-beta-1,6-N-acetylglucosamine synthase-like glycosyltransferase